MMLLYLIDLTDLSLDLNILLLFGSIGKIYDVMSIVFLNNFFLISNFICWFKNLTILVHKVVNFCAEMQINAIGSLKLEVTLVLVKITGKNDLPY
jgi:hypothetical protein